MQLPWEEHFREIVIPAWQACLAAERRLTLAVQGNDAAQIERAKYDALRESGAATFYVHHFAEVAFRAHPKWLAVSKPEEVWDWVASFCTTLRTEKKVADVALLGDIADALKHAILTRRLDKREVAENDAVLVVAAGYGTGRFGEGKFSGLQVVVLAKSGRRSLSTILQNVIDAWRRAAGLQLPEIGAP